MTSKIQAKRIIIAYGIGVVILVISINMPFSVPCIWKSALDIPCPSCGLTRAFVLASQFRFIDAVKMNILFLPLAIGMAVFFLCALLDLLYDMQAIRQFNDVMDKKWVIVLVVIFTALSWYYNIVRGI